MFDKNVAPEGKASQLRKFSSHWSYPLTQAGILSAPKPTWFFNYLKTVLVFSTEPEPVSFTKLARGLLHLVDDGGVVVGDVEGDGAGGEEDEGLEQSLCLQEQPAPLLLEVFLKLEFKAGFLAVLAQQVILSVGLSSTTKTPRVSI